MVLVDTSVWIRFLLHREPYLSGLDALLQADDVVGHDLVFAELLMGDKGGRLPLLLRYEQLRRTRSIPHEHVLALVRNRRLNGRGVGWIDVQLLASAISGGHRLWTADPRFAEVAQEVGVAYSPK